MSTPMMYRVTLELLDGGVCINSVTRTGCPEGTWTRNYHEATAQAILSALRDFWGTSSVNVIRLLMEEASKSYDTCGVDLDKLTRLAEASSDKSQGTLADLAWQAAKEIEDRRKRER